MTDRLLELFEQSNGAFLSGEELSERLQISRTAVWKQIERLRQQGYRFEAAPRKGYRLLAKPDIFDLPAFIGKLQTERFGKHVKYYDEVDSTQTVALSLVAEGPLKERLFWLSAKRRAGAGWADSGTLRRAKVFG